MDIGEQKMAQVKHAFVVTSAINSKFGVYSPAQRLEQTLDTIKSIRDRAPGSLVFVMECTGIPISPEQANALTAASDGFIDYSTDPDVQAIYESDNWDVVKNTTEIMCFSRALRQLAAEGRLATVDRIHKMSGRYLLNEQFDIDMYDNVDYRKRIIIGPKQRSQFPLAVTLIPLQYMARLWSWPADINADIIKVYEDSLAFIAERVTNGGYADIEHVLFKFLPPELVTELEYLGVEGTIAPNGQAIKN
jgi:hypothetical protein